MSPPKRQDLAQISEELGINVMTVSKWRETWRLQVKLVPASEKEPEGWSAAEKFTVVLKNAGLNAIELTDFCRERDLYRKQVDRCPPVSGKLSPL